MFLQSWEQTKRKKAERRRLGVRWVNRDPFLTASALDPSRSSDLFGSEEYSNRVSVDWDEETGGDVADRGQQLVLKQRRGNCE